MKKKNLKAALIIAAIVTVGIIMFGFAKHYDNMHFIKCTVLYQGTVTTFDSGKGDEIRFYDESSLPLSIKINGEWKQFGWSLIDNITEYVKEED